MRTTLTRERAGSWSWILQAMTGVLLILLVGLHMIGNHFVVKGGLRTYADVVKYLSTPFIFGWEVIFLIVVAWHALLGVRAILLDFGLSRSLERGLNIVLAVIGVATVVYGLWLSVVIVSRGASG